MKIFKRKNFLVAVTALCVSAVMLFSGCNTVISVFESGTNEQGSANATQSQQSRAQLEKIETSYGYQSLNDVQRLLYESISQQATEFDTSNIVFEYNLSKRETTHTIVAFLNDHPEVFWVDYDFLYGAYDSSLGYMTVGLEYICSVDDVDAMKSTLDGVVDEIVSSAPNGTDYEIEKYINDYLVENCEYNDDAADAAANGESIGNEHNAYGALVEKTAVCDGFSEAFQLLCNKCGIECVMIMGIGDEVSHAWNAVRLDGNWTYVDVTWNENISAKSGFNYMYLNRPIEFIERLHQIFDLYTDFTDEEYESVEDILNTFVPECTDTTYDYMLNNCSTLTGLDNAESDGLIDNLAKCIENKEKSFAFEISDTLDYDSTYNSIVEDGYFSRWVDSAKMKNIFSNNLSDEYQAVNYHKESIVIIKLNYE